MPYFDDFRREISYLRVSITDRCNLRCVYCMPPSGVHLRSHEEILSYEEIACVVRAAAELGIHKVRLTGGEPLVRAGLVNLVEMLAAIPGIDDLSMTTNGTLLAAYAHDLKEAGLKRVNVSLDTLRPERFQRITGRAGLDKVLEGIAEARKAGLEPVKINIVVLRGLNDDEIVDFARLTLEEGWHVRFIEMMPLGAGPIWAKDRYVSATEIRRQLEKELAPLQPARLSAGGGPARYFRLPRASGTIGFISPISEHFCATCNRLRLTADGRLRPCLLSDHEIDLRPLLRQGAGPAEIRKLLIQAICAKPERHRLDEDTAPRGRVMSEIGG
ncbi:MAG: GTP 3',8-cyclase MoaA [Anaerolineae bacterium]